MIDLGNWADERYAIPVAPAPGSAAAEDLDEIDAASNDSDENDSGPEDDSHGFNPQL